MPSQKKNIPWTLRELVGKIGIMSVTLAISLFCGIQDSYSSFYIAVLIQSLNNVYESMGFLSGYNRFITVFQFFSFLGAVVSGILAVLSFAGASLECIFWVWMIAVLLGFPIFHFLIEAIILLASDKY